MSSSFRAKKKRRIEAAKKQAKSARKALSAQRALHEVWRNCSLCHGEGRVVVDQGDNRAAIAPCPNGCKKAPPADEEIS